MTTVSQLVEKVIAATGKPGEDVRARAKRLRHVGMLPSGARGRGAPHVFGKDTIGLLLTVLAGNAQVRAEQAPQSLWNLRYNTAVQEQIIGSTANEQVTKTTLLGPPNDEVTQKPFGDLLVWMVDEARTEEGRRPLDTLSEIRVWQDGTTAALCFSDGRTWWFTTQPQPSLLAHPVNIAPARTMTSVPAVILSILADCVNDSAIASEEHLNQSAKGRVRQTTVNLQLGERAGGGS